MIFDNVTTYTHVELSLISNFIWKATREEIWDALYFFSCTIIHRWQSIKVPSRVFNHYYQCITPSCIWYFMVDAVRRWNKKWTTMSVELSIPGVTSVRQFSFNSIISIRAFFPNITLLPLALIPISLRRTCTINVIFNPRENWNLKNATCRD